MKRDKPPRVQVGSKRRKVLLLNPPKKNVEASEIEELHQRIQIEIPNHDNGYNGNNGQHPKTTSTSNLTTTETFFDDLPLSKRTKKGLASCGFIKLTPIQQLAIPLALTGKDVLGEAKTGSGKTLAFIIPVLENLYRNRWTAASEGLAALVITPTRELAAQIYDVCVKVGRNHAFSAGCCIGGKDLIAEQVRINQLNILIATPGRLQQHMQESPLWDASNLQMLIVDEADRMLDMGFVDVVKSITDNLPTDKQSLFFSATLRSAVRALATLSIRANPVKVSVDPDTARRTPDSLKQLCVIVPLQDKYDILFSFLRTHGNMKTIIFVSSCKQVRFLHDAFQQINLGCALLEVHGRQCQQKRLAVFETFKRATGHIALFSTDLASRGIDFPTVDWVVQVDCPDCVDSYIHRVGRTARFESSGNALLILLPSEIKFLRRLEEKRFEVRQISINPKKRFPLKPRLQALLSNHEPLLYLAQRALMSYVKSVSLMRDKHVFDVSSLPITEFADAIGLPEAPEVKFTRGQQKTARGPIAETSDDEEVVTGNCIVREEGERAKNQKTMSKLQKLKEHIRLKKSERKMQEQGRDDNIR